MERRINARGEAGRTRSGSGSDEKLKVGPTKSFHTLNKKYPVAVGANNRKRKKKIYIIGESVRAADLEMYA